VSCSAYVAVFGRSSNCSKNHCSCVYPVGNLHISSLRVFNCLYSLISGKSTTAGHLIYNCRGVDEQTINKLENEAKETGSQSSKYAWIFDKLKTERETGRTTDTTLQTFENHRYKFNIIDAPGCPTVIENTITGTSQADVALLVIDASEGCHEAGMDENGQTREHALLAYALGVKQMIVAVNKMDDATVDFSEDRWKMIRSQVATYLKGIGYHPMKIPFIPVSSWLGDNLTSKSIHMPWYDGPSILEALENVTTPRRPKDKPLRVPIQDVRDTEGIGTVLVGRVETGVLKPGTNVQIAPSVNCGVIRSLQIDFEEVAQAIPGDVVSINIDHKWDAVSNFGRGHVLSNSEDRPAQEVSSFDAQIIIMNHSEEIFEGKTLVVDCHTSHTPCTVDAIQQKMDRRTGKVVENNPKSVKTGDACIVRLKPSRPLCVEQFKDFPSLGRFSVRDSGQTVGFGVVKKAYYGRVEE